MITRLSQLKKVLIANRGEIACRIIRTTKRLGIKSVAVFSEADARSKHVSMADEAFCIGSPQASDSYLRGDKILEVARRTGAQAVHPGYGFLSENAEFAEECAKNEVIFIGPSPSAIRSMGVKSTSKKIMSDAGVPVVPGYHGENQDVEFLATKASEIGYPIMIKAVRGGGGKGMRIARTAEEFMPALESAKTEALRSFGDEVVLLEKFIQSPRHVEVQVFGDTKGNTVHLFERDCSVQRRHQKVIEQAPGPHIDEALRHRLGETGVRSAKAVGYVGAGTVEFIFDSVDRHFYFMEMNTRLQVEHPVTEMITGVDLVEWQLRVCSGETLPMKQEDIPLQGVAVEARVYAESLSSSGEFMPSAGRIQALSVPDTVSTVRIESGISAGDEVSVYYDPMIAKVVVWGSDQNSAFTAMDDALSNFNIVGLDNNIGFLRQLVRHTDLIEGNVHTDFISEHKSSLLPQPPTLSSLAKAALTLFLLREKTAAGMPTPNDNPHNPFISEPNFRVNSNFEDTIQLKYGDSTFNTRLSKINQNKWLVDVDGKSFTFEGSCYTDPNGFVDGKFISNEGVQHIRVFSSNDELNVFDGANEYVVTISPKTRTPMMLDDVSDKGSTVCPMPGIIDKVFVKPGDLVNPGDRLAVMIAMKMEYVITAKSARQVEAVHVTPGQSVQKNSPVVTFKEN